jgi:hypothetical protein
VDYQKSLTNKDNQDFIMKKLENFRRKSQKISEKSITNRKDEAALIQDADLIIGYVKE